MKQRLAPAIAEVAEEAVPLESYARRFAKAPTEDEIAETMDLVRWFRRRYPTPKERFAYIRRKYLDWTRHAPVPIERIR